MKYQEPFSCRVMKRIMGDKYEPKAPLNTYKGPNTIRIYTDPASNPINNLYPDSSIGKPRYVASDS